MSGEVGNGELRNMFGELTEDEFSAELVVWGSEEEPKS